MGTSIIIVNYNTRDLLFNCITSIYATQTKSAWEIIVVDNASTDGSVEMLEKKFPEVRCIKNTENKGFGYANNQGISVSRYEYLLLLNSDTIVQKDIISVMKKFMDNNLLCGGITPEILFEDGSKQATYGNFPTIKYFLLNALGIFHLLPLKYRLSHALGLAVNFTIPQEVPHILGVCMYLRKSIVKEVGGFDEDYFLYFEETDLCYRVRQRGFSFWVLPQISVLHLLSKSSSSSLFKTKNLLMSRMLYFRKRNANGIWIIALISYLKLLIMSVKNRDFQYLKIGRYL